MVVISLGDGSMIYCGLVVSIMILVVVVVVVVNSSDSVVLVVESVVVVVVVVVVSYSVVGVLGYYVMFTTM